MDGAHDDYEIEIDGQEDVELLFTTLRRLKETEAYDLGPQMKAVERAALDAWLHKVWSDRDPG